HRADLHAMLADAVRRLKPDAIHLGKRCAGVTPCDGHAVVRFDTGETVRAAYVIGADGIHSQVRECLFGPGRPEFTGVVAWRATMPMGCLPSHLSQMDGTNWLGPSGHVLHYHVHRGTLMNLISLVEHYACHIVTSTVVSS